MSDRPSVLVVAPPPLGRLQQLLIDRTLAWATTTAPGRVEVTDEEGPQHVLRACQAFLTRQGAGPLLLVGTTTVALGPHHAAGALEDLACGCDLSVGPTMDGGVYLLAMARPLPELFAADRATWDGPQLLARGVAAWAEGGLSVGLLRAERALRTPADAAALAADPLTPAPLRALLS